MDQSPQGFASEDEEATYCLSLLRDGDRHQKIVARERLSQIFERRGLLDEAAQCLESNIREGVRDPRVYQRLAGVYRRQGRHELADEVLVEARRLAERMVRPPQGGRRPGPARPGRPSPPTPPPTPPPGTVAVTTPTTAPPAQRRAEAPSADGGELELDSVGAGPRPGLGLEAADEAAVPAARPWWLSPAMLVLLVLLCGPYGLALMWVRGGYAKQTKVRVTAVWAGLVVLMAAAAAVTMQSQVAGIVAGSAGLGGLPVGGVQATPISFSPATAVPAAAKPSQPVGAAPSPPTIAASPGLMPTGVAGTTIGPAPTVEPGAVASPTVVAQNPDRDDEGSERMKVTTGGGSANLRDKPGQVGVVVKAVSDGAIVEVIGEDKQMDGKTWKNVKDEDGDQGWMAAELLGPA